jgi:hypothetical protein
MMLFLRVELGSSGDTRGTPKRVMEMGLKFTQHRNESRLVTRVWGMARKMNTLKDTLFREVQATGA